MTRIEIQPYLPILVATFTHTSAPMFNPKVVRKVIKPVIFIACLLPLAWLIAGAFGVANISLGANPVAKILHQLGQWGLRFIVITLCISPLRSLLNWPWLVLLRRMLGLFAFTYVLLHFLTWLILDQGLFIPNSGFTWHSIIKDITKRPYITIGFAALLMLIPLAITSTNAMMRRLGKRWQQLHRLVYVIAVLGVWHYYWQVKKDVREPLVFAAIVFALLAWRYWRYRNRLALAEQSRSAPVQSVAVEGN
ncbi:MAG TPA: protein-methionine-sulfoxide reductase heme-binding subunit MsrQ [Steroidobacteraceae bacterium]|nr:protein-methionine-sulfoxide reductase heme-binding subunit MsrQ [Steroidobacteraceae bacterium]